MGTLERICCFLVRVHYALIMLDHCGVRLCRLETIRGVSELSAMLLAPNVVLNVSSVRNIAVLPTDRATSGRSVRVATVPPRFSDRGKEKNQIEISGVQNLEYTTYGLLHG